MPYPTFDYEFREFAGPTDFEVYVMQLPPVKWAKGVVLHHTWSPTLPQWHQSTPRAELDTLAHYYQYLVKNKDGSTGWPAGPHLFISDTGIYQMTPVTRQGVHAGECNSNYWGFEIVGDYDEHYWSPNTEYRVLGAVAVMMRHAGITVINEKTLRGHRDCASPKTCPGSAIALGPVRKKVIDLMGIQASPPAPANPGDITVIGVPQAVTYNQWRTYLLANGARLLETEMQFIYAKCVRYEVRADFLVACWKQESYEDDTSTPEVKAVLGGGTLQRQTHCPLNIVVAADDPRDKVQYKGKWWRAWEGWQIGLDDGVNYLKQQHGAHDRLTVEEIITAYAPPSENDTATYIKNVKKRMDDMARL